MSLPRDETSAYAMRGDRETPPAGGPDEVFIPMVSDGVAWLRICEPQHDAATACMRVAEYIRLLEPGRKVGELKAAARSAAEELEKGAPSATIAGERHCVQRSPAGQQI